MVTNNYWDKLTEVNNAILETNIELKKVGNSDNKKHKELVDKHYNLILAKRKLQNEAGKRVREAMQNNG